jgi:hypothetical protein
MSLKSEIGEDVVFAGADRRLLDAAVSEGLTMWYVEEPHGRPEMIAVDSADIHSVGYDAGAKKLYVQLRKNGKTYVPNSRGNPGFPADELNGLCCLGLLRLDNVL